MKRALILLCLGCYSCSQPKKNETSEELKYDSILGEIDKYITSRIDSGFSGVALIADGNDIIFHKAYSSKGDSIDTNTAFWIASNTKPITAIAILKLAEQGKLFVKDPISRYIKNVPLDKESITIEQLLTHTSGLPNDFICEGEQDRETAIKKVLSQRLIAKPGDRFSYTNDGYIVLAAIIEIAAKSSYESYLKESIFQKSGMKRTNFWGDDRIAVDPLSDSAIKQPFYSKIFKGSRPLENWNNRGAAGISSSTGDLYKMLVALKAGRILNTNSFQELFRPRVEVEHLNDTTLSYGYGWAIVHEKSQVVEIRHRGRGDWMHNNSIFLLPNDFIIIAWSKDAGPNAKNWSTEICKHIIEEVRR